MAITVGNTSNSGDPGTSTSYSWNHTCAADTTLLVVGVSVNDTTDTDRPVNSITYNGVGLTQAVRYNNNTNNTSAELWYLANPQTGSALSITVTHAGKCTDTAGMAIDLLGTATVSPVHATSTANGTGSPNVTTASVSTTSGEMAVAIYVDNLGDAPSLSVSTGTEIAELDIGATTLSSGYNLASGASTNIVFTDTNVSGLHNAAIASFKVGSTDLSINKSETITITENKPLELNSFVNKSENITLTENIIPTLISDIKPSDSITLTETIIMLLTSFINVSENISITDTPLLLIPFLTPNISDSINVTENIQLDLNSFINKSDSITVTDTPVIQVMPPDQLIPGYPDSLFMKRGVKIYP